MLLIGSLLIFMVSGATLILLLEYFVLQRRLFLKGRVNALEKKVEEVVQKRDHLEDQTQSLGVVLGKTVKMYEAARDICTSLDEEQVLNNFKEDLKKFIDYKDFFLVDEDAFEAAQYTEDVVFPLAAKEARFGYLVIQGAGRSDRASLHYLINHFALGLKRARLYKMVQELAITDSLTGLFTRRYCMERLKEEFERSKVHGLPLSFLMIDIDDFKKLNDKYGHLVGDAVLCEIGNRIKEGIREVDMVARFGGEEFMVFAPNTSKESARPIAGRIRKGVASSIIRAYDEKIRVTVSVGLATYPGDAAGADDLVGKADWALYRAKKLGKNRTCLFGVHDEDE